MKKFKFSRPTNSTKLMTTEGEIEVNLDDNTSVISDTLAALLGENNMGEIVEDLGDDSEIEGMVEGGQAPPPPPPPADDPNANVDNADGGAPLIPSAGGDLNPLGDGSEEVNEQPSQDDILKGLLRSTVEELKALAVEAELPEAEYAGLNKMALAKYLIEKVYSQPQ